MKKISFLITAILLLSGQLFSQEAFTNKKFVKLWSTPTGLDTPESAHYNPFDKTIYISNIVGKHDVKDGIGFISKVNTKGEIIEKEWVKGLNAPKGISSTKTNLYVTDIDRLIEISLKTGQIIKEYHSHLSKSLNDISIGKDGRVYVSDAGGDCVFYMGKDSLELLVQNKTLVGMNGIYAKGTKLYMGSNGNFISIDQKTKKIEVLTEKVGYLDGIEQIAPKAFITSDWAGTVQLIRIGKGIEKLLDTAPIHCNAADLGYIPSLKILLVPTFFDNKVVAYDISALLVK